LFFKWLEGQGVVRESAIRRMKPPSVPETPVPVLPKANLRKLLAACEGTRFEQRRDTALIRVLLDTGVKAGEVTSLHIEAVLKALLSDRDCPASESHNRPGRGSPKGSVEEVSTLPLGTVVTALGWGRQSETRSANRV
jgi:hypothetical protein